jgi:hypothetical protein
MFCILVFTDRYEKRHKNLAVHVSPAFRVEIGDMVTVGAYSSIQGNLTDTDIPLRPMQAAVEDSPIQCDPREQEQGVSESLWKVLSVVSCSSFVVSSREA